LELYAYAGSDGLYALHCFTNNDAEGYIVFQWQDSGSKMWYPWMSSFTDTVEGQFDYSFVGIMDSIPSGSGVMNNFRAVQYDWASNAYIAESNTVNIYYTNGDLYTDLEPTPYIEFLWANILVKAMIRNTISATVPRVEISKTVPSFMKELYEDSTLTVFADNELWLSNMLMGVDFSRQTNPITTGRPSIHPWYIPGTAVFEVTVDSREQYDVMLESSIDYYIQNGITVKDPTLCVVVPYVIKKAGYQDTLVYVPLPLMDVNVDFQGLYIFRHGYDGDEDPRYICYHRR
jgi:hypothetical protein